MCGICGIVGPNNHDVLRNMIEVLRHRGPDGTAIYEDSNVALGFARLAVIDLRTGMQPIHNENGDVTLVFNGEIYNYRSLRRELESLGHSFYTNSDSETIVHAYEQYGLDLVDHLEGMFAFAIWDSSLKRLVLARDRAGIKPLYYALVGGQIIFASEIKAILKYPGIQLSVSKQALQQFLAYRYTWLPETIFKGISRLPPGCIATFAGGRINLQRYWDWESVTEGTTYSFKSEDELMRLLEDSVSKHMISDVPIGAYLSGGIDSSLLVALMSKLSTQPVETFSVRFENFRYDESEFAKLVADEFSCVHHELTVSADSVKLLPEIVWHLDEPIADPASIPTYELSRLARRTCKVVLTGEGGDEVFGGYEQYRIANLVSRYLSPAPKWIRKKVLGPLVKSLPMIALAKAFPYITDLGPDAKLRVAAVVECSESLNEVYKHITRIMENQEIKSLVGKDVLVLDPDVNGRRHDPIRNYQLWELSHSLPENLLMKVDKTTMAFGVEARVPYLDHHIVQFGLSLPPSLKVGISKDKILLRRVASRLLPKRIVERKKQRFFVPIHYWLSQENGEIIKQIMEVCCRLPYFDRAYIREISKNMSNCSLYRARQIWNLITFTLWHSIFLDNEGMKPKSAI